VDAVPRVLREDVRNGEDMTTQAHLDASKRIQPPDRIVATWCSECGHVMRAAPAADAELLASDFCPKCRHHAPVRLVRYQLAQRRG
jgi:hypothetical protein